MIESDFRDGIVCFFRTHVENLFAAEICKFLCIYKVLSLALAAEVWPWSRDSKFISMQAH
jgi:hypothetical protein